MCVRVSMEPLSLFSAAYDVVIRFNDTTTRCAVLQRMHAIIYE